MRRWASLFGAVALAIALSAGAAQAGQGTGVGKTANNAALGFVAMSNLSGQLDYVADPLGPDAGFRAHCDGYTSFVYTTSRDGYPQVQVTATCEDATGQTIYLRAAFTDRGEPGTKDSACLLFSYNPNPTPQNSVIVDMGRLKAGNIQIKKDPLTGDVTAQMLII